MFFDSFSLFYAQDQMAPVTLCSCALFNVRLERFSPVNMSYSLRSLMTKEQLERFALFRERIILLLFRSQKTSESLEKPMSKFLTLVPCQLPQQFSFIKRKIYLDHNIQLSIDTLLKLEEHISCSKYTKVGRFLVS